MLSGFAAAREIRHRQPAIPILFFSIHDTGEIIAEARAVGDGFLLKDKIVELLPLALEALLNNRTFFPSEGSSERQV